MISAIRLPSLYSLFLRAKNWSKILSQKKFKPSIVSQHCVVYKFALDLCDADYAGYTARHLHQRQVKTSIQLSVNINIFLEAHGDKNLLNEDQFRVLKKCHGKFDSLIYEMLLIKELRPSLNTQSDSISAKLFV